jgi:hypothetical protein
LKEWLNQDKEKIFAKPGVSNSWWLFRERWRRRRIIHRESTFWFLEIHEATHSSINYVRLVLEHTILTSFLLASYSIRVWPVAGCIKT